jgi:uncharacterized protein involved in exopolysaccharide biosynthesis
MESLRPRKVSEFVEIFWRKKKLLFLMMLAALIATSVVISRIPNKYESSSMIVIGKQASDEQRSQLAPRFSALIDQISSRDNLTELVKKYNLYPELSQKGDPVRAFQKDLRDLKTTTKIREYYPQALESVKVIYRYSDPVKAQQVVADITRTFTEANLNLKQESAAEYKRIDQKIADVERQLRELGPQKDINQLRLEMLAGRQSDPTLFGQAGARVATEQTVETLRDEKAKLELQIEEKKNEIADQEKIVKQAATAPSATATTAIGTLLGRKLDTQAKIDAGASKGYLDKHPEMQRLRAELQQLDVQIARLESNPQLNSSTQYLSPEFRDLRKMQRDLASLQNQLEFNTRKLNTKVSDLQKLPALAPTQSQSGLGLPTIDATAKTQYEQLITHYQWLLSEQDKYLKQANAEGMAGLMYQVTEQPNLPKAPVAPNKLMLQFLALGIALIFGLVVAFGAEAPKFFQINDERDIEYYLGAPVLALIPETLTPIERNHKRKLKMTRGVLLLILVGAMIPVFVLVLNTLQIFQILGNK